MIKYIMIKNIDRSILLHYKTMRKCLVCKEYITLEDEWDNIVHYSGQVKTVSGVYHKNCFMKHWENGKIRKEERCVERLLSDSQDELFNLMCKNHLYKYFQQKYDVIMLPSYIFTKLEQIFTGKFKQMSRAIPPSHLLEMFERKESYLDGIYHKEKLDGVSLVNYNLAVLIAKYPKFLEWKERSISETISTVEYSNEKKPEIKILAKQKSVEPEGIFSDIEEGD